MSRKAVIAGATGLIGKELVQLLLSEPEYTSVTLIVRRPTGITHPKLHEKVIDFDNLEQADVNLTEADAYCTLGTTIKKAGNNEAFRKVDYTYPLTLGQMAKKQGAKQLLIVTSIGSNSSSRSFYTRVKGEIEESLRGLNLPTLQIFRPSLLLGNREEFRFGEGIASSISVVISPLLSGSLRKYKPIQARSVAKAMQRAALSGRSGIHIFESDQIAQLSEPSKSS